MLDLLVAVVVALPTKNPPSRLSREVLIRYELGCRPRELSPLSRSPCQCRSDEFNRQSDSTAIWNGAGSAPYLISRKASGIRRPRLNQWRESAGDKARRGAGVKV